METLLVSGQMISSNDFDWDPSDSTDRLLSTCSDGNIDYNFVRELDGIASRAEEYKPENIMSRLKINEKDSINITRFLHDQDKKIIPGFRCFPPLDTNKLPKVLVVTEFNPSFISNIVTKVFGTDNLSQLPNEIYSEWPSRQEKIIHLTNQCLNSRVSSLSTATELLKLSGKLSDFNNNKVDFIYTFDQIKDANSSLNGLVKLRDDCTDNLILIQKMVGQVDKINIQHDSDKVISFQLEMASNIIERLNNLYAEFTKTYDLVKSLILLAEDVVGNNNLERICILDNIIPDWSQQNSRQLNQPKISYHCYNYEEFCSHNNVALIDNICKFLADPEKIGNTIFLHNFDTMPFQFIVAIRFLSFASESIKDAVQYVQLNNSNLNDDDIIEFASYVHLFKNLKWISIKNNSNVTSKSAIALSKSFRSKSSSNLNVTLKYLTLDGNNIDKVGARALARSLPRLLFLEYFSLSHNPIGDEGLYFILKHLTNRRRKARRKLEMPSLKSALDQLNVAPAEALDKKTLQYKIYFGDADYESDMDVSTLYDTDEEINKPETTSFYVDNDGTYSDSDDDDDENNLKKIKLENSVTYDERLNTILYSLPTSYRMLSNYYQKKKMFIYKDHKRYKSIRRTMVKIRIKLIAVSAFLGLKHRGMNRFTNLNVSYCQLTARAAKNISIACIENTQLIGIDLSGNFIGDEGCKYLMNLLKETQTLLYLYLNSCKITDSGVEHIAKGAVNHKSLLNLSLDDNDIGEPGAFFISGLTKYFCIENILIEKCK